MAQFFTTNGGVILTTLGVFVAVFVAGVGSVIGTHMVGVAGAGLVAEEPDKFGQALVLQLLPGTQGLYGFIIGFLLALKLADPISMTQGIYLLIASLPVGFMGLYSAKKQAEVAVGGLGILAKRPEHSTKGIIFAAIVETYAILAFVISIIMVIVTYPA
jgi:ATP synthase subunit C.